VDTIDRVTTTTLDPRAKEIAAVKELRRLIESGGLQKYYDAVIGRVVDTDLEAKANELFANLPKINAAATAEELTALGLWTVAPRGIEQLLQSPRYLPGRRLLVFASLNPDFNAANNGFLTYLAPDQGGVPGVTCRAVLMGEKGDSFLVHIDGKDDPVEISKKEIYKYNQPTDFRQSVGGQLDPDRLVVGSGGTTYGEVDYREPLTKAKVCEVAIRLDKTVGQLDFAKALTATVMGDNAAADASVQLRDQVMRTIRGCIDMEYYKSQYAEKYKQDFRPHAARCSTGRAAIRGTGKCHDFAIVGMGLLSPFAASLGIDASFYYGHCYRGVESYQAGAKLPSDIDASKLIKIGGGRLMENPFVHQATRSRGPNGEILKNADGSPVIESGGHSFTVLYYRGAGAALRVSDPTWGQPCVEADVAFTTKYGDRNPDRNWFVPPTLPVAAADVDCSGRMTSKTPGVMFGSQGAGRENHISSRLASLFGG